VGIFCRKKRPHHEEVVAVAAPVPWPRAAPPLRLPPDAAPAARPPRSLPTPAPPPSPWTSRAAPPALGVFLAPCAAATS